MPQNFHIGELAARTGRSIHALRWYEAQGLMPGVMRDRGGRRIYVELHVSWVELIDRLRRTGMSIAQIREYAALVKRGSSTLKRRRELLEAHRKRVEARIMEWTQALELLDYKIDFYGQWLASGRRPKIELPAKFRKLQKRRRTK